MVCIDSIQPATECVDNADRYLQYFSVGQRETLPYPTWVIGHVFVGPSGGEGQGQMDNLHMQWGRRYQSILPPPSAIACVLYVTLSS